MRHNIDSPQHTCRYIVTCHMSLYCCDVRYKIQITCYVRVKFTGTNKDVSFGELLKVLENDFAINNSFKDV